MPSLLRSPESIAEFVEIPVYVTAAAKLPLLFPNKTLTSPDPLFVTAISRIESPLKYPAVTPLGVDPT